MTGTTLKDGVYYDLPAETYHALQRFSASGIKKILVSAQDFWVSSWMNKGYRPPQSDALNLGTAYHTRLLEGRDTFDRLYRIKPPCDRRTKEGKIIYADWRSRYPDAEEIGQEIYSGINAMAERVQKCAILYPYLSGGRAEVSILWHDEETNVPMKSRLDYVLPTGITDLKTFSNDRGLPISKLIASHISSFKYHVQAAVYRRAFKAICSSVKSPDFNFMFVQTGQAQNALVRQFPETLLLAEQGRRMMRTGINKFRDMYLRYGEDPWFDDVVIEPLKDESFPMYVYEEE